MPVMPYSSDSRSTDRKQNEGEEWMTNRPLVDNWTRPSGTRNLAALAHLLVQPNLLLCRLRTDQASFRY